MEKQKTFRLGLSAAAFCVLLIRPLYASFLIAPAVTALLFTALMAARQSAAEKTVNSERNGLRPAAMLLSMALAVLFLVVWLRTKRLVSLQFFEWRKAVPILLCACAGALGSLPFLSALLNAAALSVTDTGSGLRSTAGSAGAAPAKTAVYEEPPGFFCEEKRLLFCVAAVAVSVCSLSSPLYPFNDWVDANCFFTVGKSMLFGIVPYRDLYEQKGPLLYALYAMCYLVSHRSFLGGWLLEILAAWSFLSLAWRCHILMTGEKNPVFLFLTAALVYTAPAFLKGGSAEELSLPLVMLSFYYGLRCIYRKRDLSKKEAFLIGLSSGAVLWIKYSMLGFYLGFILVPAVRMLRERHVFGLLKTLGMIVLGVTAASLPILAYFGYHHALSALWEAYFYNNLFAYSKASSLLNTVRGLASGFASLLTYNDATVLLVLFSLFTLWRKGERVPAIHVFLSFGFAFGMIYAGGINMKYYSEILCVFIPLGVTQLLRFCTDLGGQTLTEQKGKRRRLERILIPLLFTLSLFGSENSGMLLHSRAEMPQFVFAEALEKTPDATLFNYGSLDIGLFTTADILPSTRYFCMLNLPSEEMVAEMEHYMRDGVTDYIVSRGLEVDSPCYRLQQTVFFPDNGTLYPYYLYARSEESSGSGSSSAEKP